MHAVPYVTLTLAAREPRSDANKPPLPVRITRRPRMDFVFTYLTGHNTY